VFVSGKEWQFKDWPFRGADDGDLVETFQKVRGYFATYDTESPVEIIKTWNVQVTPCIMTPKPYILNLKP